MARPDQVRANQVLQMKTEGRRRHVEPAGKGAGGEAFGSRLNQLPEYCQPVLMSERIERGDDSRGVHEKDYTGMTVYFKVY